MSCQNYKDCEAKRSIDDLTERSYEQGVEIERLKERVFQLERVVKLLTELEIMKPVSNLSDGLPRLRWITHNTLSLQKERSSADREAD